MADGHALRHRWTVRRTNHQLRKILPQATVIFDVKNEQGTLIKHIELRGTEIRKNGLWKDITNKALGGLPGLQKEGTDGIITSALFILYPEYEAKKTLCLEFFGPDFDEASRVILELSRIFPLPPTAPRHCWRSSTLTTSTSAPSTTR